MAQIDFLSGSDTTINTLNGSGLAFMGSSWGYSVAIGSFQDRTFISDSTGTSQGPESDNCKYLSSSGVVVGNLGSGISLLSLPNYLSTLNVRFTHTSAVKIQNARVYGYDRVSKNNIPSGVLLYGAQIIHTNPIQNPTGSGSNLWVLLAGSGSILALSNSPGTSGYSPNGPNTNDTQHDYYLALTATPTTVGSKEFSLLYEMEYL